MRFKRYELCLTPPEPGATRARFSSVPAQKLPDQPNSGPEEGWGAPFELPSLEAREGANGASAAENVDLFSLVTSSGNLKLALARPEFSPQCWFKALNRCRCALPARFRARWDRCVASLA